MYKYPLMQRESMGLFHVSFSNPVEILWPRTWAFDVNYVASTHSFMRNVWSVDIGSIVLSTVSTVIIAISGLAYISKPSQSISCKLMKSIVQI